MADLAAKREAPPLPQLNEEPPGVRAGRPPLPLCLRSSFPTFASAHRRLAGCYSVPGDGAAGPCSAERGEDAHARNRLARNRLARDRSEEHTSELQSLMRISYAVFCLKKNKNTNLYPDAK